MGYRVDILPRASRDLRAIYDYIAAGDLPQARAWFNGLEALIMSLDNLPARGTVTSEDETLRQLLYGTRRSYRVIYAIDEVHHVVSVLHIRHSAQDAFTDLSSP